MSSQYLLKNFFFDVSVVVVFWQPGLSKWFSMIKDYGYTYIASLVQMNPSRSKCLLLYLYSVITLMHWDENVNDVWVCVCGGGAFLEHRKQGNHIGV